MARGPSKSQGMLLRLGVAVRGATAGVTVTPVFAVETGPVKFLWSSLCIDVTVAVRGATAVVTVTPVFAVEYVLMY